MQTEKPAYELADIFRLYGDEYRQHYHVSHEQRLVMRDIVQCRTAALGGHVDECDTCGGLRISYNSCRNRHCPKCGALAKLEWLEKQKAHLLPTHYFHVVFTIDHLFNPLARVNQKQVYSQLFASAAATLKAFGQQYLGGEIGFTAILHTWGQTLTEHIHLHCIVTGGALTSDGKRWRATAPDYLFPIIELSAQFRDNFCAGMQKRFDKGEFDLCRSMRPFSQPSGISAPDSRIAGQKVAGVCQAALQRCGANVGLSGTVCQPDCDQQRAHFGILKTAMYGSAIGITKRMASGKRCDCRRVEFIRRFLQHTLPKRFVRVRHYGLLAPRYRKEKLARCRALLGAYHETTTVPATTEALLTEMLGHDPTLCPLCGVGQMQLYEKLEAHPTRRQWQLVVH